VPLFLEGRGLGKGIIGEGLPLKSCPQSSSAFRRQKKVRRGEVGYYLNVVQEQPHFLMGGGKRVLLIRGGKCSLSGLNVLVSRKKKIKIKRGGGGARRLSMLEQKLDK